MIFTGILFGLLAIGLGYVKANDKIPDTVDAVAVAATVIIIGIYILSQFLFI